MSDFLRTDKNNTVTLVLGAQCLRLFLPKCLILVLILIPLFPGNAELALSNIYTIQAVKVDKSAVSAAAARDLALIEAQRTAFNRLMLRLVVRADRERVPEISDSNISSMLATLQVENEKTSKTRYIATLVFRFHVAKVRDFLRGSNIAFSETLSKTRLLIPVYESAGLQILWDEPNPWREAWQKIASGKDKVMPFILPEGSLSDIANVSANQAASGNKKRLLELARRYNLTDVLVAHGVLMQDLNANVPRLHVTMRKIGPVNSDVIIQSFTGTSRNQVNQLIMKGAEKTMLRLEDDWKASNRIYFNRPDRLSVQIVLPTASFWVTLKKRIESIALVDRVEISYFSRDNAQVILHYFGDPKQLVFALSQRDLLLHEKQGFWLLQLSDLVSG